MGEATVTTRMTADEFLRWAEGSSHRYELENGEVVAMAPERVLHSLVKGHIVWRLQQGIEAAGLPCLVVPDGLGIRIGADRVYEPDVTVLPGIPRHDRAALAVDNPLIVVEVTSPSSKRRDMMQKLDGYFALASLYHYIVVDPDSALVAHSAAPRRMRGSSPAYSRPGNRSGSIRPASR